MPFEGLELFEEVLLEETERRLSVFQHLKAVEAGHVSGRLWRLCSGGHGNLPKVDDGNKTLVPRRTSKNSKSNCQKLGSNKAPKRQAIFLGLSFCHVVNLDEADRACFFWFSIRRHFDFCGFASFLSESRCLSSLGSFDAHLRSLSPNVRECL